MTVNLEAIEYFSTAHRLRAKDSPLAAIHLADYGPEIVGTLRSLLDLVDPIIERSKGRIGTHSDSCHEYHVACLAVAVRARIVGIEPSDAGGES